MVDAYGCRTQIPFHIEPPHDLRADLRTDEIGSGKTIVFHVGADEALDPVRSTLGGHVYQPPLEPTKLRTGTQPPDLDAVENAGEGEVGRCHQVAATVEELTRRTILPPAGHRNDWQTPQVRLAGALEIHGVV